MVSCRPILLQVSYQIHYGFTIIALLISIPDRDLGLLRPPAPEALLYLVFKVQFREPKTKVPFHSSTCQSPIFHTHSKNVIL